MDEKFKRETGDEFSNRPKTEEPPIKVKTSDGEKATGGEEEDILRRERPPRKMAYICAPYRPTSDDPEKAQAELKENIRRLGRACRTASAFGRIPIAPALYFTRFLRDTVEREREEGLELGLECIRYCEDLIIIGNRISEGMRAEIMEASRCGVNIIIWRYPDEPFDSLFKEVLKYSKENHEDADDPGAEETEKKAEGSAKELKEGKDHE